MFKNKAHIILTVIAVLAIVSTILAFKNSYSTIRYGATIYCSATTTCLGSTVVNWTITDFPIGVVAYCTTSPFSCITKTTIITVQD
jgi:hypothetical protein